MPDENTKITLEVNLKHANVILAGLAEQPWRIANEVIASVSNQMREQLKPDGSNVTPITSATGD